MVQTTREFRPIAAPRGIELERLLRDRGRDRSPASASPASCGGWSWWPWGSGLP